MTPEQQHHIRNGSINVQRIARTLLRCGENLSGNQKTLLRDVLREGGRIEEACGGITMEKKAKKSWMTNTGNGLLAVGSLLGASAAAMPVEEYRGWLAFSGIITAGLGQMMANKGIRRRLPVQ